MSIWRRASPALDGAAAVIGDGTVRTRSLMIPSGEYATPLWLRPDGVNARVVRVDALPWQGVIRAGQIEVLSSDPFPGDGEPQYTGAVGQNLVFQDDMESYASFTTMGEVDDGSPSIIPAPSPVYGNPGGWDVNDPANYAFVTGRSGAGQALRIMRDGLSEGAGGVPASLCTDNVSAPLGLRTHYASYWGRNIPASNLTQPLSIKWFWFLHNAAGRCEFHTHFRYVGTTPDQTYWNAHDGSNTTEQGQQPVPPWFDDLTVVGGAWHRFTYQYRPQSAQGARDGFARMWVDGTKVVDVSQEMIGITPEGGVKHWCTQEDVDSIRYDDFDAVRLHWLSVQTTSSPAWTFDLDDLTWWWE